MELLESSEDRGFPTEYLLSRIRGRRARLITDWRPLIADISPLEYLSSARYCGFVTDRSPDGIWKSLIEEFRWVYVQMNGSLRDIFAPFFLYSELRTLFICLRLLKNKKAGRGDEILSKSLLSANIKKVLKGSHDITSAAAGIERLFLSLSTGFQGIAEQVDTEGLRGIEQRLLQQYLVYVMQSDLHPLVKAFFIRLIDSRNIISLYKYLRLEADKTPSFIPFGSISETRLIEALNKHDIFGIGPMIQQLTGVKVDATGMMRVENALYQVITRFLKKAGRDPLGIGPLLDYLWRCSIEAMNLSILLYGKDLERDGITRELVQ
ncbi:MAG: V-type ATPase subunit [Thermodesulfovibrionales bacterium]|jgi:vacuolar-type H+-ATPase subunit C/Vma6